MSEPGLKDLFGRVERYAYIAVGMLLVAAAIIAIAGSMTLLWQGVLDWTGTTASMIEFGVLAGLILVMVFLIFLLHRIPTESKQT